MSANVFAFPGRGKGPQPWTNDELAELYRVVDLLGRAGLSVATDMGMSDEGDPWFVFCRVDNEEVIAHFARIDGIFVAASIAVDETFRGANFRQIVDRMVSSQPLVVPPPRPGSRLFVHPAVLLTAFVATALAHSEKMHAQDWLRSVEAQWEHGKESALHSLKQVKTGWADTLHTLMKLPALNDARVAYDSAKEGLTLTLASLIAIAMTALQPISEKMSAIALLVDDFPAHAAEAVHQGAEHIAALVLGTATLAAGDSGAGAAGGHNGDGAHPGSDSPMAHKAQSSNTMDSASADGSKVSVDAAHLAAPMVQKVMADDAGAPHLAAIDTQFDFNLAALAVQKVVTPPVQASEPIVVHVDTGSVTIPTLDLQDVTPEAIRLLDIKVGDDAGTSKAGATSGTDATNSHPAVSLAASGSTPAGSQTISGTSGDAPTSAPAAVPVGPVSDGNGNQVIDVDRSPGQMVENAVANFVTDGTHAISQQVAISDPIAQQELAGILSVYGTVKVVFFESAHPISDVFIYSSGVVFVEEKDVASSVHLSNPGGDLILEGGAAGTMTLVGVAIVGHLGTA